MGNVRNSYTGSNIIPQGNRLLGRVRRRLESNVEMDLENTGCEDVDCVELTQDGIQLRDLVKTLINF
jgi:hypothetical protein